MEPAVTVEQGVALGPSAEAKAKDLASPAGEKATLQWFQWPKTESLSSVFCQCRMHHDMLEEKSAFHCHSPSKIAGTVDKDFRMFPKNISSCHPHSPLLPFIMQHLAHFVLHQHFLGDMVLLIQLWTDVADVASLFLWKKANARQGQECILLLWPVLRRRTVLQLHNVSFFLKAS